MLKKLFSSGNVTTSSTSNTHRSCSSQHKSKQENNRSNAQPSTNNKKEIGLEDKTSFLALLTQLEDFEGVKVQTSKFNSQYFLCAACMK
jgi:histone deacetylase complex regulatory component SIN3